MPEVLGLVDDWLGLEAPGGEPGLAVCVQGDVVQQARVESSGQTGEGARLRLRVWLRPTVDLRAGVRVRAGAKPHCKVPKDEFSVTGSVCACGPPVEVDPRTGGVVGWRAAVLPPEAVLSLAPLVPVRVQQRDDVPVHGGKQLAAD